MNKWLNGHKIVKKYIFLNSNIELYIFLSVFWSVKTGPNGSFSVKGGVTW